MKVATGEFISFIDSDDWVDETMLEKLYNSMISLNTDITICGVHLSTAGRIVNNLVEKGVLLETTGKNRNQMFVCKEIMDILNSY